MTRKKILAYAAALLIIALVSSAFLRPGDGAGSPDEPVIPSAIPVASLDVEPPRPESTYGAYCTATDLTPCGGTMVVLTKSRVSTGYDYSLEYWDGEQWLEQPQVGGLSFFLPLLSIAGWNSERYSMNWSYAYGRLTPGYYRIKKNFGCAQFIVHEDGTASTVLPENRFGTAALPEDSGLSLEELVYEADAIAHVRVTSWLGDFEGENLTAFAVERREALKGELPDDFVLIQDGTSENPCADFPLFAAGNELLVFLDEVPQEEHDLRVYGKSYRIINSCRSLWYIGVTDDWDVVAVQHDLNEADTLDFRDIAPVNTYNHSHGTDAFFAVMTERDPEFWTSDEAPTLDAESSFDRRYIYYLSSLRDEIDYCIDNPPYLGETPEVYVPQPDIESDFAGVPEGIVTIDSRFEPSESSGDTIPEPSGERLELLSVSVMDSNIYGPNVSLNLRANEGTLPSLDADSILLEQWLGGNWTKLDLAGSTIQCCIHDAEKPMVDAYDPADTPPHTEINYELFLRIDREEELYRFTAEFTENPDGSGERYTLQFKFDTSYVLEEH